MTDMRMKGRSAVSALCTLLVILAPALLGGCAGNGDMVKEIEGYEPPAHLVASASAEAMAPVAEDAGSVDDDGFEAEKARLDTLKATAAASLDGGFYPFDGVEISDDEGAAVLGAKFDLAALERLVRARNPGIRAAHQSAEATLNSFDQVTRIDEILRSYTAFTEGVMTGVGPMRGREPVGMRFPFPGTLALKGRVAEREAERARHEYDVVVRDTMTEARVTYWELAYVIEAHAVRTETMELVKRLEKVATALYEAGKTSFQDVIKVRVKLKTLSEGVRTLERKKPVLEAKIFELAGFGAGAAVKMGAPADVFTGYSAFEVPPADELVEKALANRQELSAMRAGVARMEAMLEMAETMAIPAYDLGFSRFQDEAVVQVGSSAMKPAFPTAAPASMGVGSAKYPWYGAAESYLSETRMKLGAMKSRLSDMEAKTRSMVEMRYFAFDKARREYELYDNALVDLSKAALEVSTSGYQAGGVMFADVISSYNGWLEANLERSRRKADLGISLAQLEQIVGARVATGAE